MIVNGPPPPPGVCSLTQGDVEAIAPRVVSWTESHPTRSNEQKKRKSFAPGFIFLSRLFFLC